MNSAEEDLVGILNILSTQIYFVCARIANPSMFAELYPSMDDCKLVELMASIAKRLEDAADEISSINKS